MNPDGRKGKFAALIPAVWAGTAALLIFGVSAGCLNHETANPPAERTPIQVAMVPVQPDAAVIASYHAQVEPILKDRCYQCHSGDDNHTGIAFDTLTTPDSLARNPELWLKVLKNTRSHVMPPPGQDAPTADEQLALENWIEYSAFGVDRDNLDPGRQTLRRLNRTEYHNTILDLTGVDFDTEGQFPNDDIGYGFDNIGDVLNVSPMLMEKYMLAAQNIVAQAVPAGPLVMPAQTVAGNKFSDAVKNPNPRNGGTLDLSFFNDAKVTHTFNIAIEGDYRIVVDRNIKGSFDFIPARCTVAYTADEKELSKTELVWHDDATSSDELPVHWTAGKHTLTVTIHPTHSATPDKPLAPLPAGEVRTPPSLTLRILKVQLQGPTDQSRWVPAPGYERFFPRGAPPRDAAGRRKYAREILGNFAARAFRRPPPAQTVDRLVDVWQSVSDAPGGTFEKGISQAMVAILSSARFVYRIEGVEKPDGKSGFVKVDEYSLASRLSYFLWSTMPDEELMKLAAAGQLRANLDPQIKRMLADPRSHALVENFTGQWLQSREVTGVAINVHEVMLREGVTVPNNQQVSGPVRAALKEEPEAYFAYIMHGDRSVKEFLDSDYTFLNQALADYYKIPGVAGPQMRKVTLKEGDLRGGALTFGATLMVTSNPTRTSPVKRGKWVLENILGAPTPPPPPDIPPLELSAKGFKDKKPTLRQILAVHRASPVCASCHDRMDPIGLAMENFNAAGQYRKAELEQPIDPAGELFTGEQFKDISELKAVLAKNHLPEFYRCLTEKMMIYATGRGMEYYDMPTIDKIVEQLNAADGRFSVLLNGVIESAPFQEQRLVNK